MERIIIRNTEEKVRIKITLSYVGPSRYIYVPDPERYFDYASSANPPKEYPHSYEIGKGSGLTEPETRANNWNIELMNPSDNELEYTLKIEWFQGNSEIMIYRWPVKEEDIKGKVKAHTNIISFAGNSLYKHN